MNKSTPSVPADDLRHLQEGLGEDLDTMLVYNVLRTAAQLTPAVDACLREQRLTATQFNALLVLRQADADGMPMGEIGRRLVVTKSNVTGLVDRLERQGLAERVAHADRRSTPVRLTEAGRALVSQVAAGHAEALSTLTGGLAAAEKRQLVALLSKLRRALRRRAREGC